MKEVGRNELCPCGSGKKYKNCHMSKEENISGKNKTFIYGLIILVFLIIAAVGLYFDSQRGGPPPGAAPEGKVWSEEHGHYH